MGVVVNFYLRERHGRHGRDDEGAEEGRRGKGRAFPQKVFFNIDNTMEIMSLCAFWVVLFTV